MPIEVLMPALSPTMTEGKIDQVADKKPGDAVEGGRPPRRDRDRQGDDGFRGRRRGHARPDHRARRQPTTVAVNTAHRKADWGGRRRENAPMRRKAPAAAAPAKEAPAIKGEGHWISEAGCQALDGGGLGARRCRPKPLKRRSDAETEWTAPPTTMTVREALRDAMAEEMRRDRRRVPDGRGSLGVPGRLQGQPGPACRNSAPDRVIDTPISEHGFRRASASAPAFAWPQADRRVHDLELRHAGDGSAHQLRRQDALYVRRAR